MSDDPSHEQHQPMEIFTNAFDMLCEESHSGVVAAPVAASSSAAPAGKVDAESASKRLRRWSAV
eukprot:3875003-Karenia_brevis.AAC.1